MYLIWSADHRHPAVNYMFKVSNRNTKKKMLNMFKVNNKDTTTTLMAVNVGWAVFKVFKVAEMI